MLTTEDFEYIRELKMEGYTWPEIAKFLDMPAWVLKKDYMNWLRENRENHVQIR